MKKRIIIIGIAILAIVLAAAGLATRTKDESKQATESKPLVTLPTEACELVTLDDAKNILGASAEAVALSNEPHEHAEGSPENHPHPNELPAIPNITLTGCTYNAKSNENGTTKYEGMNVEVRTPQNAEGITANKTAISEFVKSGTKIQGNENAYWIADRSLLVIVQGDQLITATRTTSVIEFTRNQTAPPETKLLRASQEQSLPVLNAIKTKL